MLEVGNSKCVWSLCIIYVHYGSCFCLHLLIPRPVCSVLLFIFSINVVFPLFMLSLPFILKTHCGNRSPLYLVQFLPFYLKSQILVQEDTCSPQMDSHGYITHAQYAPIQHGQNPESICLQKGNQQQCTGHHTVTLWKMLKIPEANGKQVFL